MDVREVYQRIQALQDEIAALGPLDPEVRKRIDYKFRLDWNYHSNNIEGGTLTVAETKSIMLGHVTVEDKPLRDILEMRGHDQVVKTIMAIGKGELQLSEKRIKEIHRSIIHENDPAKQHLLGTWKQEANEIINKGEKVGFAAPVDVPDAMHKLLDWFKVEQDKIKRQAKDALPAPRLAFEFHLRFLTIHPFYDGNGRVGRILLNLILISLGYPPIIVTQEDKPKYNDLLTEIQLNGGSRNDLWVFLGRLVIRSLELVKRAIDGEELDSSTSIEEKLNRLEQQLALVELEKRTLDSIEIEEYLRHFNLWIFPILEKIRSNVKRVEHLFEESVCLIQFKNEILGKAARQTNPRMELSFLKNYIAGLSNNGKDRIASSDLRLFANLKNLKAGGDQTFSIDTAFIIAFEPSEFTISTFISPSKEKIILKHRLGSPLSEEDVQRIANDYLKALIETIENQSHNLGII